MKALRLVILWALTIFSSQLWGYSSTTELTYRYDVFDSYFFSLNTQPETQNRNYDENSNFRYSGRKYIDSYYQKKTQSGSFFVFEVGFVATKGGGGKPDFIVSPNGTALPTNKDFNLVDSNKKGGDWLQIHNKHTDAKVDGSPHTHFPKQHGKSRTREIKRTDGGDIDRADSALRNGSMRQRKNRGDKGGS